MNPKQQFADVWAKENATTRRVLTSVPRDQGDARPIDNMPSVRELAFVFSKGQSGIANALTGRWEWPGRVPPIPDDWDGVLATFDATTTMVRDAIATAPLARLDETIEFYVGPKRTSQVPVAELIWFMLLDSIHHRGQLSVYLRALHAKVPSIYGPSADEPWM
jgi:uncharacterized damage-inducible protein DinB